MAFNGSGVFSLLYNWVTEQASSPIEISKLDAQEEDIATALSNCVLRDGTGVPTANTDWNGKRITNLGAASAGTDALSRDAADARYYIVTQNSQSSNYTLVLTDAGKQILHPSGGGSGDTFTIPANASVAFTVGTTITFVNLDSNSVSIAITSDTMTTAGGSSTGTRTLAQNGVATILKVTSTSWLISGVGLT